MGKPTPQPDQISESSSSINHFSHPHPLQLSQPTMLGISCSGCNLEVSGMVYSCATCNYFLHPKCSKMPQQITHPYDQEGHVLSLLPKPIYPEGIFRCDACGQQSPGFCYHCKICGIDLHILCAASPMTFMHQFHQHQLQLTFSPPYPGKSFTCDMCRMKGSNVWLYHCNICQFDLHLTCLNKQPSIQTQSFAQQLANPHIIQQQRSMPNNFMSRGNPQSHIFSQHSLPNPAAYNSFRPAGTVQGSPIAATTGIPNYGVPVNNFANTGAHGQVRPARNGQGNGLLNQVVGGVANGIASGASQAIAGALMQELMGGGGVDGGNNGGGGFDSGNGMDAGYMDGGDGNNGGTY